MRALTGVDTDRLPEEKARGISIDLGFAYKPLPGGQVLGFVDVPGHVRFIHNMLAGAVGIDFVLLVVAADDGPMPQTLEHLAIIDLLGIRRGLVVLTKCDLVDAERRATAVREVAQLTVGTPFEGTDVFQVSVVTREGLDALERRLSAEATTATRHRAGGCFRMAVDRRFVLPGAGTVVTGTVFAGQVAVGNDVVVTPLGLHARVRGLHANNIKADRALSGQRCAINLSGAEISTERVHRGDWIVEPGLHAPTDRFDATLRLLTGESRPFRHWTEMQLHIGTAHVAARVALLGETPIPPGGEGFVQIVPQRPLAVLAGDRLVLRQPAAQHTAAGGVVLDPWPPNRGRRRPERQQALTIHATQTAKGAIEGLIRCEPGWIVLDRYCRAVNLTPQEAGATISRLVARNVAVKLGDFLVSIEAWTGLRQAILDALARHHASVPNAPGLELGRLRLALEKRHPAELFATATDRLLRAGAICRSGPRLFLQGHTAHLSADDQPLWKHVRPSLASVPFSPPRVRNIAQLLGSTDDRIRAHLRRVVAVGLAFEVAHDHFYLREAVASLAEVAHQTAERHGGTLATSEFRDRIGVGRKIAIQILEFLDKHGVTVRKGDGRVIRSEKLGSFDPPPAEN